jgi:hypothetical protein
VMAPRRARRRPELVEVLADELRRSAVHSCMIRDPFAHVGERVRTTENGSARAFRSRSSDSATFRGTSGTSGLRHRSSTWRRQSCGSIGCRRSRRGLHAQKKK